MTRQKSDPSEVRGGHDLFVARFAMVVRAIRGDRSLRDFATEVNVSPATLLRIEQGKHTPSLDAVLRIIRARHLSIDGLIRGTRP